MIQSPGSFSKPGVFKMDEDGSYMTEKVLDLTLEIIYLLTGESFPPVKSGDHVTISVPSSPSLTPERNNTKKILDVTRKIIELLTGEVPIRCQDVTVYFSMEEWEYLEGHKDLHKDIMMENRPPLTSSDGSSNRNPPERSSILYSRDSTQEDHEIPHHDQGEDLMLNIKIEDGEDETFIRGLLECKEEDVSTDISAAGGNVDDGGLVLLLDGAESTFTPNLPSGLPNVSRLLQSFGRTESCDTKPSDLPYSSPCPVDKTYSCTECGRFFTQVEHINFRSHSSEKPFSCSECDQQKRKTSSLIEHQTLQICEKPFLEGGQVLPGDQQDEDLFPCTECGKLFRSMSYLVAHQKAHTREKPFICSLCGKCFTQNSTLLRHCRVCTKQEPALQSEDGVSPTETPYQTKRPSVDKAVPCSECGKIFTCSWHLAEHRRIHTGEKPYFCVDCGKHFSFRSSYVSHRKLHSGEKPFCCLECGKCFSLRQYLIKHQKVHRGERPFSCSECGRYFVRKERLMAHLRSHSGEKPFSCLQCGKSFTRKSTLLDHEKAHRGERPHHCSECGKCFRTKSDMARHKRVHTGEKPYPCPLCGKVFQQNSALIKHQTLCICEKPFVEDGQQFQSKPVLTGDRHDENLFPCTECGKQFRSKSYLVIHQRTHTGEKPFMCSLCGKCFTQNSTLLRHRRFCPKQEQSLRSKDGVIPSKTLHQTKRSSIDRTIPCSECGKIFTCTWHLAEHQRIHTGEKPYFCADCGKRFSFRSSYVSHRKLHSSEKPFSCLDCGKCFTLRQYLVKHQKIHRGERPFSCLICEKSFREKSDLMKHQRVHTGEKPYSCNVCGKRFSGSSDVARHQKTHTREKPYSCSDCGKCFLWRTDLLKHQWTHDRNIINTS